MTERLIAEALAVLSVVRMERAMARSAGKATASVIGCAHIVAGTTETVAFCGKDVSTGWQQQRINPEIIRLICGSCARCAIVWRERLIAERSTGEIVMVPPGDLIPHPRARDTVHDVIEYRPARARRTD